LRRADCGAAITRQDGRLSGPGEWRQRVGKRVSERSIASGGRLSGRRLCRRRLGGVVVGITRVAHARRSTALVSTTSTAAPLACERCISGHGPRRPAETLAELARAGAEVSDPDFYGEGALIEDFEREIAQLLGKEAAVFLPSGTMAQQIALRIWSERTHCATV